MQEPIQHDDGLHNEYRTGAVEPRPKHSGLIALLLIAVIVLSGGCIILGAVNVQLFSALTAQPHAEISAAQLQAPSTEPELPLGESQDVTIQIQPEPLLSNTANPYHGLSLQQIFTRCAPSLVCINADGNICSGIVISENGYIVTSCRLVEDAKRITVRLRNNERHLATLIGRDWASDLAVLHIDAKNLPAAFFGDAQELAVGDPICTLTPEGLQPQSGTICSITQKTTCHNQVLTLIGTDTPMKPGTPLINIHGQIVGIHTANSQLFGDANANLIIPSAIIKQVAEQLIAQGHVSGRPSLGIWGQTVSQRVQNYYHVPAGLFIDQVEPQGPAGLAGVCKGDIVIALNSSPITCQEDYAQALYSYLPGTAVSITVYRGGRNLTLRATVAEEGAF